MSFNDFHMARYDSGYVADRELLAIDHCREGRMEYQAGENPPSLFNKCSKNSPTSSGGEMNCTSEHICSKKSL